MNGFHFYATYNNNITKVKLLINEKREKEKIEKEKIENYLENEKREKEKIEKDLKNETY